MYSALLNRCMLVAPCSGEHMLTRVTVGTRIPMRRALWKSEFSKHPPGDGEVFEEAYGRTCIEASLRH